ncbi:MULTISPECIES: diiron oxygenase [Gordonia]|uniref:Diiron oxygenase n=1 Tax=Gordonia amicalis TaxID=89053 RepID=A0ABU4DF17_9ACTN|nr:MULTISPECIES: diiron oxygenase [Gordonia]MDJ0453409.1 diiron oxygenase [Gordonia amicalis]MDV6308339.1 diiron oxygenase [Gordonia amicalis]MDV7076574.1 diiron oxygenase [Gordonia amicalis]MDV7099950.1 diiron oxygenase [Gordonia amicalis]UPW14260.1 diiron oxygenase [Gordonia amicalis]
MSGHVPEHDASDPVETAVIRGLVRSWPRRATVRRTEPELDAPTMDDLYDDNCVDYPEVLLPFAGHPVWERLDEGVRSRILAWAWIAYNKNVVDIEQDVVTPGFGLLFRDAFGTGFSDAGRAAVVQSMVDEEYHTLMHLNASALTRRRRGWALPDAALPETSTVRRHREALSRAESARAAALTTLAYATVAETSIADYLTLIADDRTIQPVHQATIALHRRDERAHASVASEMIAMVHDRLDRHDRNILARALCDGVDAFTATDGTTWSAILAVEQVADGDAMLREVAEDPDRRRFLQDCTAIDRLLARFGELDRC